MWKLLEPAGSPDAPRIVKTRRGSRRLDSEELFKTQRPRLLAIAYGMLGSASDAEDVVQEAFLRWQRGGTDRVDFPERYLARIVTRLSIDHLRAVKRRREDYVGVWLPGNGGRPGSGRYDPTGRFPFLCVASRTRNVDTC